MEFKIVENKKDVLVLEFDEKILANVLASELKRMGVDSYAHDPHPLILGTRLHIEVKEPMKSLKKAMKNVAADWKNLSKLVEAKTPKK